MSKAEKLLEKEKMEVENDLSLKPPKKWWDELYRDIKKGNPGYSDKQVKATVGNIWYDLSTSKKKEIRGREGKSYGSPKESNMNKSKSLLKQITEDFMKPEVFKDKGVEIDTTHGTFFFPSDVINPENLGFKGNETTDKKVIADLWDDIGDYLEVFKPDQIYSIRKINGWFGRYSAPGYMDATDWSFNTNKKSLMDDLKRMYGDED